MNFKFTRAPDIEFQPRVRVHRWQTYASDDELILVCELPDTGRIRATTAIAHWDTSTGQIVTQSGRVYELMGPMAENSLDFQLALVVQGLRPNDDPDNTICMSVRGVSQLGIDQLKKGGLNDDAI